MKERTKERTVGWQCGYHKAEITTATLKKHLEKKCTELKNIGFKIKFYLKLGFLSASGKRLSYGL